MRLGPLNIQPRGSKNMGIWLVLSPILAGILTLLSGTLIFSFMGKAPLEVFSAYFIDPISSLYGLSELTLKATPLILIALGLSLGFRANVWNIGGEGQFIMGTLGATLTALYFYQEAGWYILPLVMLGGMVAGMAWAWIPALLKVKLNTNEILTSLMLVYIAQLLLSYLVTGPLKDPEGYGFPQSRLFSDSALLGVWLEGTRAHWGEILVVILTPLLWIWLKKSYGGLQLSVLGLSPKTAKFMGFSQSQAVWLSFLFTGALAGLSGAFEVSGPAGQLVPSLSMGYGFAAIIVAFIGRLHPLGIVLAGLLMGLFYLGAESAQMDLGLPLAISGVFQGLLLFYLLATDFITRYQWSWLGFDRGDNHA